MTQSGIPSHVPAALVKVTIILPRYSEPGRYAVAVMRDLQRCCSQCGDKALCEHELEDHPKSTSWPKYCPNEQTIDALVAERKI